MEAQSPLCSAWAGGSRAKGFGLRSRASALEFNVYIGFRLERVSGLPCGPGGHRILQELGVDDGKVG